MADLDECPLCGSTGWHPVAGESGIRQCDGCGARWHKSWSPAQAIHPLFDDEGMPDA